MELLYNDDPDNLLDYVYVDLRGQDDVALYAKHHPYYDPKIFSFRQFTPGVGWRTSRPNNKINIAWTTEIPTPEFLEETKGMYVITGAMHMFEPQPKSTCFFPWHLTETARHNRRTPMDFSNDREFLADALLGINKNHRVDLFERIRDAGLLDSMLVSMMPSSEFAQGGERPAYRSPRLLDYEHPVIKKTLTDELVWNSMEHIEIFTASPLSEKPVQVCIPASQFIPTKMYQHSWLSVVAETDPTNEWFFPTEKTAKALASGRIFLLSGSRDYLRMLRAVGFKRFSLVVDERYNELHSFSDRNQGLVDELKRLSTLDLGKIYGEIAITLKHNQDVIYSRQLMGPVLQFLTEIKETHLSSRKS